MKGYLTNQCHRCCDRNQNPETPWIFGKYHCPSRDFLRGWNILQELNGSCGVNAGKGVSRRISPQLCLHTKSDEACWQKKKNSFVLVFGMSTSRSELYYKAPHRWSTIAICMWVNIPCAVFFREGQWPYHGQDLLSEAASSLSACPWSTRPLICHLDSIFMPRCFQLCEPLEWGRAWVCVRWKLVDR